MDTIQRDYSESRNFGPKKILMGVYARRGGSSLEMASGHSLQSLSTKLHPSFIYIFPSYFTISTIQHFIFLRPLAVWCIVQRLEPLHQNQLKNISFFTPYSNLDFDFHL